MTYIEENGDNNEWKGYHFVLVHGASHGAWCWYKVQTLLQGCGHKVTSIDLKSAGIDPSDPNTLFKFDDYNQPLLDFISSLPLNEKVILVGHSAGGADITQALQRFPTKMEVVVYLAAKMSKPGGGKTSSASHSTSIIQDGNVLQLALEMPPQDVFDWTYGLGPDAPPTSVIMKKEYQRQYMYNMSPLEDCTLASLLLRPCPTMAMADGHDFPKGQGSDKVPRVYIKTLHDKMISQQSQDELIKGWPPNEVLTIDSDHAAFFSNPIRLFSLLLQVASTYAS